MIRNRQFDVLGLARGYTVERIGEPAAHGSAVTAKYGEAEAETMNVFSAQETCVIPDLLACVEGPISTFWEPQAYELHFTGQSRIRARSFYYVIGARRVSL